MRRRKVAKTKRVLTIKKRSQDDEMVAIVLFFNDQNKDGDSQKREKNSLQHEKLPQTVKLDKKKLFVKD